MAQQAPLASLHTAGSAAPQTALTANQLISGGSAKERSSNANTVKRELNQLLNRFLCSQPRIPLEAIGGRNSAAG